ncbi:YchJ family protein [Hoeflea sp. YIM 152468]|uniref:YchJ family protein n=1 Tax=Hoeflea sp. YIM 152468 TaxID=3031759 RepID=UPI0023D9A809|nr:YchJ family protein [Hoeflea sp. YIM 152468]MDF1608468.1 YchJ family protein [Hoeflea sp. YIM 152468]
MPPCPCGSTADLALCCGRYHAGAPAPSAEKLMRSRYAAYATGKLDYIEATCAGPAALAFDRAEAGILQIGTEWLGLEIVATKRGREGDSEGTVSFIARYRQQGTAAALSETSLFRKIEGRWVYWDRDPVVAGPVHGAGPGRIGRNDPCPCGSGRKHKRCCG